MRKTLLILLLTFAPAVFASDESMALIYKRGGSTHVHTHNDRAPDVKSLARQYGDEFLWLRRDGQTHVITDRAVLAEVREALDDLEIRTEEIDAAQQAVDEHVEEVEEANDERDDDLAARFREVERRLHEAELRLRARQNEVRRKEKELRRRTRENEQRLLAIVERAIAEGRAKRVR